MTTRKRKIMVVVHPGSACGSADMALGREIAKEARENLVRDIDDWNDGVVVIDSSLSPELNRRRYQNLNVSIASALDRASSVDLISHREFGCDDEEPHQDEAIALVIEKFDLKPESHEISITGCWTHPDDENIGCVNGVRDQFRELGFTVLVMPGAVNFNHGLDRDIVSSSIGNKF